MKPDNRVSKVSVCAHTRCHGQREVGEDAHYGAPYEGGDHGGDDEVPPGLLHARSIPRVDWRELACRVGLDDPVGRGSALGYGDVRVGAEGNAVGDAAGAAGVGDDAGIDGEDVGHGEEGGGAGAELSGEAGVALGELEVLPDSALGHKGVEPSCERGFRI